MSIPKTKPKVGIKLIPWEQIDFSTRNAWLVRDVIPLKGLTVVWGPPKQGKTFWLFDALMHVALDVEYRGLRVEPGPVVYCAFEGQEGFARRVAAFKQDWTDVLSQRSEPVPFTLQRLRLDLIENADELVDVIANHHGETPPVAVVLDTLNRSLKGSESSDLDMNLYIAAADKIREAFDCAVIIVHHCGLDASRPRGHTSLAGAADAQIKVYREGEVIVTAVEFLKDGEPGTTLGSVLSSVRIGADDAGGDLTSCVVREADVPEDAGKSKSDKSDSKSTRILTAAIEQCGGLPVTPNKLRSAFYGLYDAKDEGTKKKAFQRVVKKAGLVTKTDLAAGEVLDVRKEMMP